MVQPDKRGEHAKYKHSEEEIIVSSGSHFNVSTLCVSLHAQSLSHQNSREYLSSNLNLKIMYKLYCEFCVDKSSTPVNESYYRHLFNTTSNLSFHQPLKDTCVKCDSFQVLLRAEENPEILVQKEIHLRKAEKVRTKLNSSKETASQTNICFTFDLQKTLYNNLIITPAIFTGIAYYKRQLAIYNLGVHNLANNDAFMFMWHKGCASRGASEIGSCIWKFLELQLLEGSSSVTAIHAADKTAISK